ncbi:uncharacterized protein L203_104376 [Cryptococcus depauperatus CBS 7841]|uniref:Uncharacterized protein n=1 Tax=Cryptococcus depauperatus CBS 7841 TaxID=1295531 RepID=A0A1E3IGI2_9TREE|nr:hypothetical protein L203_03312 [Cryptococcus depauperatus CBS 7841]
MLSLLISALLAGSSVAMPLVPRDLKPYTSDINIHESCNATQRRMLDKALSDAFEVASFAKEYARTNGPADPVFQKYFGKDADSYTQVIGIWDAFLTGNKEGVILRCDNPDGNCAQKGFNGHWRGNNATSETVICDLSYTSRIYNEAFCMSGFQLASQKPSTYWSVDLIHRFFHVPAVTNGLVGHFAEDYASILELAEHNSTFAAIDSNALQYFAAHVYAIEVAKGGDACIGTPQAKQTDQHDHSQTSSNPPATSSNAGAASASVPPPPAESTGCTLHGDHYHCTGPATPTTQAAEVHDTPASGGDKDCHTHADGTVHCV